MIDADPEYVMAWEIGQEVRELVAATDGLRCEDPAVVIFFLVEPSTGRYIGEVTCTGENDHKFVVKYDPLGQLPMEFAGTCVVFWERSGGRHMCPSWETGPI